MRNNPDGDFSLSSGLVTDNGREKVTYSGIAIYHPKLFLSYGVQRLALKPILIEAINKQQLSGELYHGKWSDIGTAERLAELAMELRN